MIYQENWYKTFFDGLAVELWHHVLPQSFTDTEVQFIKDISGIQPPAHILDVPCGSGRHALALGSVGYKVTGIDISADNIELLNEAKGILPINTICADILEYHIKDTFPLVICMGNSFSYFPLDRMVLFTGKVYNALNPGGMFIVNSGAVAESLLPALTEHNEVTVGDITFLYDNVYMAESKLLRTDMQFIKGRQIEKKTSWHYVYTLAEIINIFKAAGFSHIQVYGGADRSQYGPGKSQAYFVAEK